MSNSYFRFKQFNINQSKCAMKVGTDGVMLGAWAAVPEKGLAERVLDVGCGTAIISIMTAQRSDRALIDGIDIVGEAIEQAFENASQSPWGNRISVFNTSVQEFAPGYKYDYIISNPPYFINSFREEDSARVTARHTDTLPYEELAKSIDRLLSDNGVFSVIFPYVEANIFIALAVKYELYCFRRCDVKGTPTKPVKRVMLQFSRQKQELICDDIFIENGDRHDYSDRYRELTKDFYLKF